MTETKSTGRLKMLQHLAEMIDAHMLQPHNWLVVPNAVRFHGDEIGDERLLELNCSTGQAQAWCRAFDVPPIVGEAGVWHDQPIVWHGWRVTITGYNSPHEYRSGHPSLRVSS
jgi:hypothetical protein